MQLGANANLDGLAPLWVIAAFDIGSNSIKMSVARHATPGGAQEFLWRSETTRLGAGIETSGLLAQDRIDASMVALRTFVAEARRFGATRFIGVATEATRVAENGQAFLDQVRNELGIEIETISGDREAQLTFQGLDSEIDRSGTVMVADIGGASTEVIDSIDGEVQKSVSLPIGSGRYTDRFVPTDPPMTGELSQARSEALTALSIHGWSSGCDRLVITGGTAEYMRRILGHDWPALPPEIDTLLELLTHIPASDLAERIEASELRARVLPAGVAIVGALSDLSRPEAILGAASGIRSGLLHAAFRGEL